MENYTFRKATTDDIAFLVKTIIMAEKSGTDNIGLAKIFGLSEESLKVYLTQALEEEIDGCEFSLSSFIVAENNGQIVAALGGWIEGNNEDHLPSSIIKSNIISFIFPTSNILFSLKNAHIVKSLQIERETGTYQIEYSYTLPEHRGYGLMGKLISEHISLAQQANCKKMQLHVFSNNDACIQMFKNYGFAITDFFEATNVNAIQYFPSNIQYLMEKEL